MNAASTRSALTMPATDETKYKKKRSKKRLKEDRRRWLATVGVISSIFLLTIVARNVRNYEDELRRHHTIRAQHFNQLLQRTNAVMDQQQENKKNKLGFRKFSKKELQQQFDAISADIVSNHAGGIHWANPDLLPSLPGEPDNPLFLRAKDALRRNKFDSLIGHSQRIIPHPFQVLRSGQTMAWEKEDYDEHQPPKLDYTKHTYSYPKLLDEPPAAGGYPQLSTLGEIMDQWPQDELDHPPSLLHETLLHFNYSDPVEREAAKKFRDAELPFKLYDIPDITEAGIKWTDEYLAEQFGDTRSCDEASHNYFSFFERAEWQLDTMGVPPSRRNDWTFDVWAAHARYADATSLAFDKPHFYWQWGIPKEERFGPKSEWSFVTRDLPSMGSPEETFLSFNPDQQKGIQCRYGERGVTAATHYDSGRNMVAMVTGAKRYVLSPPRECSKLGVVPEKHTSVFRHSELNFAHLALLNTKEGEEMPPKERTWLERAKSSEAIDTVLKAGEVLYIPSHWFHYIISVQKSAQCNVRSGVHHEGSPEFGGEQDVRQCN